MTDYGELKRLAEAAMVMHSTFAENSKAAILYGEASEADVVLALIAENEALRRGLKGDYDLDAWLDWAREASSLRGALIECTSSLEGAVLDKYHGQKPEDMHHVTRRDYDRDMAEINGYKALSKEG